MVQRQEATGVSGSGNRNGRKGSNQKVMQCCTNGIRGCSGVCRGRNRCGVEMGECGGMQPSRRANRYLRNKGNVGKCRRESSPIGEWQCEAMRRGKQVGGSAWRMQNASSTTAEQSGSIVITHARTGQLFCACIWHRRIVLWCRVALLLQSYRSSVPRHGVGITLWKIQSI